MIHHLVSHTTVVLKDVVLISTGGDSDLLGDRKKLGQVLIGDVVKLGTVVLGDDESVTFRDGSDVCRCVIRQNEQIKVSTMHQKLGRPAGGGLKGAYIPRKA